MKKVKIGQLRVWYMDRIPAKKITEFNVDNLKQATLVIKTLTARDLNDERITDNCMGLEEFDGDEWNEYYNDDGDDIETIIDK